MSFITYYRIKIIETARNSPKENEEQDRTFNLIEHNCDNLDIVKQFLTDRYGKMPGMRRKIYYGPEGDVVGFLHSFWNHGLSHSDKAAWWQTDWILILKVTEERVIL